MPGMMKRRPVHEMVSERFGQIEEKYRKMGVNVSFDEVPLKETKAADHARQEVMEIVKNVVGVRGRAVLERLTKTRSFEELEAVLRSVPDVSTLKSLKQEISLIAHVEQGRLAEKRDRDDGRGRKFFDVILNAVSYYSPFIDEEIHRREEGED